MSDINRADVTVTLRDAYGQPVTDEVELRFYNQHASSLSQLFTVKFKGTPATLKDVPAFPTGRAEVFIKPKRYRYKSIFINVFPGQPNLVDEDLLLDPAAARPRGIDYQEIAAKPYGAELIRILDASKIKAAEWNGFDKRQRAGLLNICAKLHRETTKTKQSLIELVARFDRRWIDPQKPERVYADVSDKLLAAVRAYPDKFGKVSGVMHKFPPGWTPVGKDDSYKTRDKAGNLQMTFAQDAANNLLADIDLDDHAGIKHAADVLKHKITGKNTDPYDIHQILIYFQKLDPGYTLI